MTVRGLFTEPPPARRAFVGCRPLGSRTVACVTFASSGWRDGCPVCGGAMAECRCLSPSDGLDLWDLYAAMGDLGAARLFAGAAVTTAAPPVRAAG